MTSIDIGEPQSRRTTHAAMDDLSRVLANKGMPYGAMPADAILEKLEVTRPGSLETDGHTGYLHKDYMVGEIIDRRPDRGFLESDQPRRNPQASREVLNLRLKGTRGTSSDLPRHPELFIGFTGDDPRGASNLPRMEQFRKHTETRARLHEVRMGDNVGHDGGYDPDRLDGTGPEAAAHIESERPWTGLDIQRARANIHEQSRRRMKIFKTAREGRKPVATDPGWKRATDGVSYMRLESTNTGTEHWEDGNSVGEAWRDDRRESGIEGMSSGRGSKNLNRARKLWTDSRLVSGTADLAVAKYSVLGRKRTKNPGSQAVAATRSLGNNQQELDGEMVSASNLTMDGGHQAIAVAMTNGALASKARRNRDSSRDDQVNSNPNYGNEEMSRARQSAMNVAEVAAIGALSVADADFSVALHGQNSGSGKSQLMGVDSGLSGATQLANRTHTDATNHARGAMAMSMTAAARKATKNLSDRDLDAIKAAYQSIAAGVRYSGPEASGTAAMMGRGAAAAANDSALERAAAASSERLHNAAANGAETASYSGASVIAPHFNTKGQNAATIASASGTPLHVAAAANLVGKNFTQKAPEYLGGTQASSHVVTDEGTAGDNGKFGMAVGSYREAALGSKGASLAAKRGASGMRADHMDNDSTFSPSFE